MSPSLPFALSPPARPRARRVKCNRRKRSEGERVEKSFRERVRDTE